jgi:hypothetical protein
MEDEKPFDLRDRIALEILGAAISNSGKTQPAADLDHLSSSEGHWREGARERLETLVRSCYKIADIARKVRLSTFE